jgi:hypothetical protein
MAMDKKTQSSTPKSLTSQVGTKTISTVEAYKHGVVMVIELGFSDSTTTYIKVASNDHGTVEVGGTNELGTGTKVSL